MRTTKIRFAPAATLLGAALAATLTMVGAHAAGIDIHSDASAADVGLPLYPGAVKRPSKEDDDHGGISLGLWGGAFGLKLAAVEYTSADGVDAVASFYRDALSKYGAVVDCSQNKPKNAKGKNGSSRGVWSSSDVDDGKDSGDKPVTCGGDGPDVAGGRLYKVGTKSDQRLFELDPVSGGVNFQLVHLQLHGVN